MGDNVGQSSHIRIAGAFAGIGSGVFFPHRYGGALNIIFQGSQRCDLDAPVSARYVIER